MEFPNFEETWSQMDEAEEFAVCLSLEAYAFRERLLQINVTELTPSGGGQWLMQTDFQFPSYSSQGFATYLRNSRPGRHRRLPGPVRSGNHDPHGHRVAHRTPRRRGGPHLGGRPGLRRRPLCGRSR